MKVAILFIILINFSLSLKAQDINDLYVKIDSLYKTDLVECLEYAKRLERKAIENNNDSALAHSYNIQARIFFHNRKYNKSINFFEKELSYLKPQEREYILAESYYNLGSTCIKLNKTSKAKKYFTESLTISKEIKDEVLIYANYEALYKISKKLKDYKTALDMFKLMQRIDETEYNESIGLFQKKYFEEKQISNLRKQELDKTKNNLGNKENRLNNKANQLDFYKEELDKLIEDSIRKQLQINSLNVQSQSNIIDINKKQEELKSQRRYTITFISAFLIILILSLFMYKLFLSKKKMNKSLITQKNKIANQNLQIHNSIKYARKIQNAVLTSSELLKSTFPDNFIFFKPRDFVSGDFYWFYKKDDIFWGAIVDCTGHGVPGAFMSIIGTNLLNKIIQYKDVNKPSELLNRLNDEVKATLNKNHQHGGMSEDGMDMTVFKVDMIEKQFTLSLANHHAFVIQDEEILTIEGDIFSIGDSLSNSTKVSYIDFDFNYNENTKLYMFSDGFQDQFGGKDDKKYTQKRLKEKISEIHNKNFSEQKEIFRTELEDWKNTKQQIDDVLLVGIKFKP